MAEFRTMRFVSDSGLWFALTTTSLAALRSNDDDDDCRVLQLLTRFIESKSDADSAGLCRLKTGSSLLLSELVCFWMILVGELEDESEEATPHTDLRCSEISADEALFSFEPRMALATSVLADLDWLDVLDGLV